MSALLEQAVSYFKEGFACSQAVLAPFAVRYGLDETMALKIASGFGGGVKSGDICGAFSGAIMVVGLKHGHSTARDRDEKRLAGEKTLECLNRFRASRGCLTCRDLLGCDVSTPEGRAIALENKLFSTVCVGLVVEAVETLEDLGY